MARLERTPYNWHSMLTLSDAVVKQMVEKEWFPDEVFGIQLGGVVPAVLVAKRLNHPAISAMEIDNLGIPVHKNFTHERILIIDDIIDTGETMTTLHEYFQYHYPEVDIKTAGLIYKSHTSKHKPDYFGMETESNDWIVYPWERDWVMANEDKVQSS